MSAEHVRSVRKPNSLATRRPVSRTGSQRRRRSIGFSQTARCQQLHDPWNTLERVLSDMRLC